MNQEFDSCLTRVKCAYELLRDAKPYPVREKGKTAEWQVNPEIPKSAGVYVFYEGDKALRVGTTKDNLRRRVKEHYGSDNKAAFAKRLARKCADVPRSYRKGEGWKDQYKANPKLRKAFEKARERIRKMHVRWVEEDNPDVRYLLEFYAAKTLGTDEYNDFSET